MIIKPTTQAAPAASLEQAEQTLTTRAQALADRYNATVVKGLSDTAKRIGSFVPFAGARETLGASEAGIVIGFEDGAANARFLLNNTPATAAQIGAAAGDVTTFERWMHAALYVADVRLK